jgi:hypothetical protein
MSPLVELRPPVQQRTYRVSGLLAAVVLGVLAIVAVSVVLFKDPTFIDTVRVDNPTGYAIHIELGTPESGSRMPLGEAVQGCVSDFHTVIDQGSTWVVSLRTQGRAAGQVTVTRDQLAHDNWTIHIPASLSGELQAASVPLPPGRSCPGPSQFR